MKLLLPTFMEQMESRTERVQNVGLAVIGQKGL